MVALLASCAVLLLATLAEAMHARGVRRIAKLAFGPSGHPALWARLVPGMRVLSVCAVTWGLVTLLTLKPKVHKINEIAESDFKNLLIIYDVSPSMRLVDAGPTQQQSCRQRAADLLKSFFQRTPIELYKVSVVAVFTGAKPVVVGTTDLEVVQNILGDLPLHFAFKPGPTDLFAGLQEAAKIAQPWRPHSTTVLIISDGDTIRPPGCPSFPIPWPTCWSSASATPRQADSSKGINRGKTPRPCGNWRCDSEGNITTATRSKLGPHWSKEMTFYPGKSVMEQLTRREYALMAVGVGSALLGLAPFLLWRFGTAWRPGILSDRTARKTEKKVHLPVSSEV